MSETAPPMDPQTRKRVMTLMLVVSVATAAARLVSLQPADAPVPAFSSNDKSRWATIRALVENGTYVIGEQIWTWEAGAYQDTGITFEKGYETVDKVLIRQ